MPTAVTHGHIQDTQQTMVDVMVVVVLYVLLRNIVVKAAHNRQISSSWPSSLLDSSYLFGAQDRKTPEIKLNQHTFEMYTSMSIYYITLTFT